MNPIASGVALALAAATCWLAPAASAQSGASEARRPDPMNPKAQVPALIYRSAFGASGLSSADVRLSYAVTVAVVVFLVMLAGVAALVYGLRRREVEA